MLLPSSSHPYPTMYAHPACISAWGGHYTIQAVAFDLLIAFSLLFPPHTRLPLCHHSSCNKWTQIGLGRGRQNERDLAMVEDPLIDFEEVVVGT